MPFNGSGTFSLTQTFTANTAAEAEDVNDVLGDIADGLTAAVAKNGESTISGALKGYAGTVSLPGYSFSADLDSGMYRIGANNIGLGVNGAVVLNIATTGLSITGTLTPSGQIVGSAGTVSAPGYTFASDLDCGFYRIGANNIGLALNGAKVVDYATTGVSVTGTALTAGPNGATNPTLQVDGSTASAATGVKIVGAAAAGGVAASVISSGTNESLTLDAKGSGTITLNGTATGNVTTPRGLVSTGTAGIGYATGAGGTVTQGTSKATGVTLDKTVGQITMHNASLAAGVEVSFTLTNSTIAAADVVAACHGSAGTAGAYGVFANAIGVGSCAITVSNLSAGALVEAIVINYVVIKGASS